MKRSLIVASCVLLASSLLTSCQKEEKSIVDLTQDLTAELQKITDTATAEAYAPRVAVLNKRYQDASVRVFALNNTSLVRGADSGDHEGASYSAALKDLAREIGRVRASFPCVSADSKEADPDRLLAAVGELNGEKNAAKRKAAGLRYMQDETGGHETPGNFPEYYGSAKLRDALAYRPSASASSIFQWDGDEAPSLPAPGEVKEEPAAADTSAAADDDEDAKDSADDDKDTADDDDKDSSDDSDADDDKDSDSGDDSDDSSSSAADDLGIEF